MESVANNGSRQKKQKIKLLEERTSAQKDKKPQPSIEDQIKSKLSELENSNMVNKGQGDTNKVQPGQNLNLKVQEQELVSKVDAVINQSDKSNEVIAEELFKYYQDVILEGYKTTLRKTVSDRIQVEVSDQRNQIHENVKKISGLITNKYEIIAREFQSQNKNLQDRHKQIVDEELTTRQKIVSNFENHIESIQKQISDDDKLQTYQNEIEQENEKLREQYESLKKEIEEKTELMAKNVAEKDQTAGTIEEDMKKKIMTQEEELKAQIDLYQNQTQVKVSEEQQLKSVLQDYKAKYDDFQKSIKKSKEAIKTYEKQIKIYNQNINELEKKKKDELKSKKGKAVPDQEELLKKQKEAWEEEKLQMNKDRDVLKEDCSKIQDAIKKVKENQVGNK